ncbi:MAG TPA: SDR family oxidoreductase [Candidatus Omnitrophota bacterium]|nr:SDR family oxidoreductase [Candidatus Omnitrophota bacterium]
MIRSVRGLVALVTGASSGIGEAMAYALAEGGADLILVSRDRARLERISEEIKKRYGVRIWIFETDLTSFSNCESLFQFTETQKIAVDVLVNNAGFAHYGPFEKCEPRDGARMIRLNVESLTVLTRLFLPGMQRRKKGGVLNVASIAGFQPIPYLSVYAATKAFVLSFSEALWAENLKHGVRVFCLCPGNTRTRFHETAGIMEQKIFFCAPADAVARFALRKFLKSRRPTAIFGFWNKVMIYAERFGPRALVVFFTNRIYGPSRAR